MAEHSGRANARGGSHPLRGGRKRSAAAWSGILLLLFTSVTLCWGEDQPKGKLLFLVARPSILDPIFTKSVVLMLPITSEPVIIGLIVNKPTRFPLNKLFPRSPRLRNSIDDAYLGGPVDMSTPALVFHAAKPPKHAMPLYDDVYLTFDGKFISRYLQDPGQSGDVRLFLGRAQWDPKQLQGEALEGSWYSLRAEGAVIFDRDSEHLWKRLHERARPPSDVHNRFPPSAQPDVRPVSSGVSSRR